ncbi:glutathione synthetase isoform X1 [Tribolium castaneum]|uniref:glutathione synthetase isoform X1 n=1 Tax=Tribolium castaneum TaxID=7070 RepID=UPI00046C2E63|nr:PREDICTED: glutathione synthetase isoform X1 [Tribolium castaneum]|eukprot:XP_008195090.1 PREDICTED: glutathione synthetase isoform X1 [Tribolium castaneum]
MAEEIKHLPMVVPLPLPEAQLVEIVEKSKDWALMHGAAMRSKTNFSEDALQFAPFVLIPSAFPRKEFAKALEIQLILNELMHKVAHDRRFLTESLKETIKVDEFTGNLFRIYETVHSEGLTQPISLGMVRSDLMLEGSCRRHTPTSAPFCCWKQVEFNTIASGFGWLGPSSGAIQRYILQELGHSEMLKNLPENNALEGLCSGMIEAWKIYGNPKAVIMFLIEDITYNICDQRFHEFKIREMCPQVRVIRRTLTDMADRASLGPKKQLLIDGCEVAVIYFRAGYEPGHYHSQKEWDARLLMERSLAIKSPSIHYHLAGTKKVQQTLAKPGALEQFLSDPVKVEKVKQIFAGLYSLDFDELGEQAIQMAIDDPERFVLKPQREGGGNNVYGLEVRDAVKKMKDSEERTAWILMERIHPPLSTGYMVRPGGSKVPQLVDMVSELGIFGVVIGDAEKITYNKQVGHMLRTKVATANEGGVAAGLGALDSPYLID